MPLSPARSGPAPRVALALLLLINLMNYVDRYVLAAVEKTVGDEFGVGADKTGLLVLAFLLSYMVCAPIFGILADRMSRWLIVGGGVLIWSMASGGSGLATTFSMLLATRLLIGIGEAAYGPVAPTIIADLYPLEARGRVLAWFYAAIPVGSAIGYEIGGLLNAHWRWAFYLTVPPGIGLGVWALCLKDSRRETTVVLEVEPGVGDAPRPAVDAPVLEYATPPKATKLGTYLSLLRNRSYVLNTAGMAAMTFAVGGISFFMPRWLEGRGLDPQKGNGIFGIIIVVAGLLATLAGGIAGDRLRGRFGGAYLLVSGGAMALAFPLFLLMLKTPFPYCWGVIFLTIFCLFFNTGPSNAAIANVTAPAIRATAFAMNIFVIHLLGDAISPYVIGFVASRSNLDRGFLLVSATIFLGALLWLWGSLYLAADTRAVEQGAVPGAA